MTKVDTVAMAQRPKPIIAMVGAGFGAIALAMLLAAPFGYRLGLIPRGMALQDLPRWASYVGFAGAAVGLLGVITAVRDWRGWAMIALVGAIIGAGVGAAPWVFHWSLAGLPPINDITTDPENPPQFVALLPLRQAAQAEVSAAYPGADVAAQQRKAYPDIVPLALAMSRDKAYALALEQARKAGWTVVASDPGQGRIEATDRTGWYGFTDDIVLRVSGEGDGSRLDIRSHSRIGRGDNGKNAERIRTYLLAVKNAARAG